MATESERVVVIRDEAGTYVLPEHVLHQYRASDEDAAAWEHALSSDSDTAGF